MRARNRRAIAKVGEGIRGGDYGGEESKINTGREREVKMRKGKEGRT